MVSRRQNPDREMDNGEAHGGADGAGKPQVQEPQHTQGSNQGSGEGRRHQEEGPREAEIPESLRAGPKGGSGSTNPFVSARLSGHNTAAGAEGVVNPWSAEEKSVPNADATGPSTSGLDKDPNVAKQLSNLNIAEQSTNPWEAPVEPKEAAEPKVLKEQAPAAPPTFDKEDSGNEAWSSVTPPTRTPPNPPLSEPPTLITVDDAHDQPTWDDDEPDLFPTPAGERVTAQEADNAWQDISGETERQENVPVPVIEPQEDLIREDGGWETLESLGEQESGVIDSAGHEHTDSRPVPPRPPNLPPRTSTEVGHVERAESSTADSRPVATQRDTEGQKKETYDIKKISWFDSRTTENPRITPILTQNANGPCPLLALVNALTIATPPGLTTPLIETLRTREQVSLELLLNAVFDELMSGRLGDGTQELPDVSDLYSFLITLHTGMNVNPSFFPPAATNSTLDPRRSMSHVHPSEREENIPGTFEQTRDIKLYSTFSIPLIHGWLPPYGSPAHTALERSARTYEDAQHLMFREEELETKLMGEGLNFEEQATLEDIATIRAFFGASATQLTHSGLDTIRKALAPGSVAILFRNDHFSTLYKHPQSEQLLHLVTDMGFSGHEEVVWESLPDINGENCEFYSGDFRHVGGNAEARHATAGGEERSHRHQRSPAISNAAGVNSVASHQPERSASEQEDHDLALALQLQEEEDERHRAESSRRRRESQLCQEYIEQQGVPTNRRNNSSTNNPVSLFDGSSGRRGPSNGRGGQQQPQGTENRPPIPHRRSNTVPVAATGGDEALPSYAQAATQPRYDPPASHPAHAGGNQGARRGTTQGAAPGRPNRRASQVPPERERDRDCVVM